MEKISLFHHRKIAKEILVEVTCGIKGTKNIFKYKGWNYFNF